MKFQHFLFYFSSQNLPDVTLVYKDAFSIRAPDDQLDINVTGFDLTPDGRIIVADSSNKNLKLFDKDGRYQSSLSFSMMYWPCGISVVNDVEALTNIWKEMQVYVIDIETKPMCIKHNLPINKPVCNVAAYEDKMVILSFGDPPSVQLVDRSGRTYWSVSRDDKGEGLFQNHAICTCVIEKAQLSVIVTDAYKNAITKLDGATGEVITVRNVQMKSPWGSCLDDRGILYVCYSSRRQVCAWNLDLDSNNLLLSESGVLGDRPCYIKYNPLNSQLLVAYGWGPGGFYSNMIDCFKISNGK